MAFDPLPPSWIASWSEDGTTVSFPIASVPELTAAEADATAGDIRKTLFAICDQLADVWYTQATADRPAYMTIYRSTSSDEAAGTETKQYVFRFTTEVAAGGREVIAEA